MINFSDIAIVHQKYKNSMPKILQSRMHRSNNELVINYQNVNDLFIYNSVKHDQISIDFRYQQEIYDFQYKNYHTYIMNQLEMFLTPKKLHFILTTCALTSDKFKEILKSIGLLTSLETLEFNL